MTHPNQPEDGAASSTGVADLIALFLSCGTLLIVSIAFIVAQ